MTFFSRLYVYLRRQLFTLLKVNVSQISIENPRLKGRIRFEHDGSFIVDKTLVHVQSGTSFVELRSGPIMLDETSGWHPIVAQNYFGLIPNVKEQHRTLNDFVIVANPRNYFHWFTEEIIRYLTVDGSLSFLAHESLPAYARDSIEALDLDIDYIGDNWIHIQNQRVYSREPFEQLLSSTDYNALSCYFLPRIGACSCHADFQFKRVYISRKFSKRPLPNEVQIEELFRHYGFEILYFENYDFLCQFTLMQNTEILAGAHGAGLTNMLWLKPQSNIIEVIPPEFFNPCYRDLAKNLSLEYKYVDLLENNALSLLEDLLSNY